MIDFIKDNWMEIVLAAIGVFTVIAAVTPTDKDDKFLDKIGAVADAFGIKLKGRGSITDIIIRTVKRIISLVHAWRAR